MSTAQVIALVGAMGLGGVIGEVVRWVLGHNTSDRQLAATMTGASASLIEQLANNNTELRKQVDELGHQVVELRTEVDRLRRDHQDV